MTDRMVAVVYILISILGAWALVNFMMGDIINTAISFFFFVFNLLMLWRSDR